MIDSYKERNGYLVGFCLCVLIIYLTGMHAIWQWPMTISSNRYWLIQLHFTLNIIVYYSLHSCCFFETET